MKRIYLFCAAGMSTSLVAKKMQEVADKHNLPVEVKAFPDGKIDAIVEELHPDVILLGPQVNSFKIWAKGNSCSSNRFGRLWKNRWRTYFKKSNKNTKRKGGKGRCLIN